MKKIIYILIINFILISCKGNEITNHKDLLNIKFSKLTIKMDTIYKQKLNELILTFVRTSDDSKVEWKTILKNKSGKEIILHSDSLVKDMGWKYKESVSESPINLYNISGAFLDNQILYIIYNRFGKAFISKYIFAENTKFTREERVILYSALSGGAGNMANKAEFIKINNDLYFYFYFGQSYTNTNVNLYKFNPNEFQKIKKIDWSEKIKRIKTICISDFGRKWYENNERIINSYTKLSLYEKEREKENVPTKEDILRFNILKDFMEKPFGYQEMNLDEIKYQEEESNFDNLGLENYPLFFTSEKKIDEIKIKKAEDYINDVLSKNQIRKNTSKVKLLDYLCELEKEKIFFFFYKDNLEVKIICYNNYDREWFIGDYKEEDIK